MLTIRKNNERGVTSTDWLESQHMFSFSNYSDSQHPGFSDVLAINENRLKPGGAFGKHGHWDMEILSYMIQGSLEHEDALGKTRTIGENDIQLISAGRGVVHNEINPSEADSAHFLRIWVVPERKEAPANTQQIHVEPEAKRGSFKLIASPEGNGGAMKILQDMKIYVRKFDNEEAANFAIPPNRYAYVYVTRGQVRLNDFPLMAGDGVQAVGEATLSFSHSNDAEVMVFDVRAHKIPSRKD